MKYNQVIASAIWFYDRILSQPTPGLKRQELITYYTENGKLHKETITRRYYGDDDYQDSVSTEVMD